MRTVEIFIYNLTLLIAMLTQLSNVFAEEKVALEQKTQIKWKASDTNDLLSLKKWRVRNEHKETEAFMKMIRQERDHKELVGRILECVGICKNDKGSSIWNVDYLSKIHEDDEISTIGNSYAWITLMDGTIVRLAPYSSITFNEINVSKKEIFFNARVNNGNILWFQRSGNKQKLSKLRETDAIFLPLTMQEANTMEREDVLDEKNLYSVFEKKEYIIKNNKLNNMIEENNKFTRNRKSHFFIVLPNGTIFGEDISMEFIVLFGSKSYVKNRDLSYRIGKWDRDMPSFFFRGHANEAEEKLDFDKWYEIDPDGREIGHFPEGKKLFGIGELPSRRISTILMAREFFLKKYSKNVFDLNATLKKMRLEHGYWLWDGFSAGAKSDLNRRLIFLKEYTRRVETTNLGVLSGLLDNLQLRGAKNIKTVYDKSFYSKAIHKYSVKKEINYWNMAKGDRKVLNSTKRFFWRLINER